MSPEVLQLFGQLGVAGLMFYLLLEERISKWLDEELDATRPKRPDSP